MERNATDQGKVPAYLIYEFERHAYPLSESGFSIGRDAASNIVVREPSVSRTHAEIKFDGGEYVLYGTGALGTRLNGGTVANPTQLKEGDRIEVGTAELTFTRAKLPLGVSVVDRSESSSLDDILSRRPTINNPILGSGHAPAEKGSRVPMIVVLVLVAAAGAYYFFMR